MSVGVLTSCLKKLGNQRTTVDVTRWRRIDSGGRLDDTVNDGAD
jgi:hypothetical protein